LNIKFHLARALGVPRPSQAAIADTGIDDKGAGAAIFVVIGRH